jgi:MEMO1 family protein
MKRFVSHLLPFVFIVPLFLSLAYCKSGLKAEQDDKNTKKSHLAGSWYPGDKDELSKMLDKFLSAADLKPYEDQDVLACIAPHAGYVYSGQGAAYCYKALKNQKIDTIFILAPSHYAGFKGFSVPDFTKYSTPLGTIEVDRSIVDELKKNKLSNNLPEAHNKEHAVEIQIPFIQKVASNAKIVPVIVGDLAGGDFDLLAPLFAKYLNPGTVFLVSSDFTHYGPQYGYQPFHFKSAPSNGAVKEALARLDRGAIDEIQKMNFAGFYEYTERTRSTICGRNPILLLLKILANQKNLKSDLLKYYTSAELTGDYSNSVSYAAIAFLRPGGESKTMSKETEYILSDDEKKTLLSVARDTLNLYLAQKKYPDKGKYKITPNLEAKRGVFVTLTKSGDLRGCIGYIEGIKPVWQAVMENATNAALEDPRFPTVTIDEIPNLEIEISVMTPLLTIKDTNEIEIGRDGLVLSRGWNKGLLLPQVATEWNMDRTAFLEAVSNKAGLPRDAWKAKDTKIEKFSAIVFGEKEKPLRKKK